MQNEAMRQGKRVKFDLGMEKHFLIDGGESWPSDQTRLGENRW